MTTQLQIYQKALESVKKRYTKTFAINHANSIFMELSPVRKEKVIRGLNISDYSIKRINAEGIFHYAVLSHKHHREMEMCKINAVKSSNDHEYHYVFLDLRTMKYHCDCQYFALYAGNDNCTHIYQIRLFNILKEYLPYFIYTYRFYLPHWSYKQFMLDFMKHIDLYKLWKEEKKLAKSK